MFDFDEEPAEIVTTPPKTAIKIENRELSKQDRLRAIEDGVFEQQASIVRDVGHFADIDPENPAIPEKWIEELGPEGAERRFRLAKAGWENGKNAPIGITMAAKTVTGIAKARANSQSAPAEVNIAVQFLMAPMANYPTKKVERR